MQDAQERLSAAQAELMAFQTRVADFELQVKAIRENVAKLRQQQMSLKTNREFRAMESEINNNLHEIEILEGQQITAMDAVPPAQERVEAAQERVNTETSGMEQSLAELDSRLDDVKASGTAGTERVRSPTVCHKRTRRYARLRVARRPTVVLLNDGVCRGGHLQPTAAPRHMVLRKNALVNCESCGRLLYVP